MNSGIEHLTEEGSQQSKLERDAATHINTINPENSGLGLNIILEILEEHSDHFLAFTIAHLIKIDTNVESFDLSFDK